MSRLLPAAALFALAGLAAWTSVTGPLQIAVADAAQHEGQTVRIEGVASDVEILDDGRTRFDLRTGQAALTVFSDAGVVAGSNVQVQGRVARWQGRLVVFADRMTETPDAALAQPTFGQVAAAPQEWIGRAIALEGTVERGRLADGAGHTIALGSGPWPRSGAVRAVGALTYDAACVCFEFDAREVSTWNG